MTKEETIQQLKELVGIIGIPTEVWSQVDFPVLAEVILDGCEAINNHEQMDRFRKLFVLGYRKIVDEFKNQGFSQEEAIKILTSVKVSSFSKK